MHQNRSTAVMKPRPETPDLTRLPQWHGQLNAENMAREFRNCVIFAVVCIFGLLAFQFLWS